MTAPLTCGPEAPAVGLDRLGAGLFLRKLGHLAPDVAAEHLDWTCVAVRNGKRRCNRARSWYDDASSRGLTLATWDWLCPIGEDVRGVDEAVRFAASVGARLHVLNIEKPHRGRRDATLRYAEAARKACDAHGIALGLVSYSVTSTIRDLPWRELAALCDVGMPEAYDRKGEYLAGYPSRAIASYRAEGFRQVVPCCGIYMRAHGDPKRTWRWRTPAEIARHLALFPRPLSSVCAWPIAGRVPADRLAALAAGVG